jgi:hypothetical protein
MILTVSLLALGFAMTAQAGPRLYEGTLIIHGFLNDTTDGTTTPFTTNIALPIPHDGHCNQKTFHVKETKTLPTYYNTNTAPGQGNGNYNVFTVPSYGGQVAVHSTGSQTTPPNCGTPTFSYGAPLTGKGTIHTTGETSSSRAATNPRGFTLLRSELSGGADGGSFDYAFPYIFEKDYADLRNRRGVFCENCGPGRYSSHPQFLFSDLGGVGRIGVTPGSHKFGGTMRLLGTMYSNEGFASVYDTYVAKYTWLFDYVGGQAGASNSELTTPYFGFDYNFYIGRNYGFANTTSVVAAALSWTTGTATVTAVGGPFKTVVARAGFDNRDPHGYGDIQMVSPMLTRWIYAGGASAYYTAGVGIMQLSVAPEPHEWMLLGAGLSMLGLLYRANRRSR